MPGCVCRTLAASMEAEALGRPQDEVLKGALVGQLQDVVGR